MSRSSKGQIVHESSTVKVVTNCIYSLVPTRNIMKTWKWIIYRLDQTGCCII